MDEKTAFITGASGGIGRAVALGFARSGWRLVMGCREKSPAADELLAAVRAAGHEGRLAPADVTDPAALSRVFDDISARGERLDALIHCAGITRSRTLLKMSDTEWDDVVRTDLTGSFHVVRMAGALMARQRSGAMIMIGSLAGRRGNLGAANYAAAKAGLEALARSAARELGRYGVRVNTVLPGFHATAMGRDAGQAYADRARAESVLGCTSDLLELVSFIELLARSRTVSGQTFNWDSRID